MAVYIGGYYMNNHHYVIPCFWKDGNNRTNLPVPSGGDGEVYDIAFMDGNMRYYGGYVLKTSSFAGYTPTPAYWRHTTRTNLPLGASTMDVYGAVGNAITIDGKIYMSLVTATGLVILGKKAPLEGIHRNIGKMELCMILKRNENRIWYWCCL